MDGPLDVDKIWISLGTFGKYQRIQLTVILIGIIPLAFHLLSTVFIAYRPPFYCNDTTVDMIFGDDTHMHDNASYTFVYNKCSIDVYTDSANSTLIKSTGCVSGYSYPVPKDRTLVTEWDLVCDRAELSEFSQTLVILGQAFGAAIFTSLADRFGRRKVHIFGHISLFSVSFAIAWAPNYTVFAVLRFFLGAVQQGSGLTMAILSLEILPLKARYIGECLGLVFWTTGVNLLSPLGYLFKNLSWRYLQMTLALFSCYSLVEYWIMDESVRWLLANGKIKQAERNIRKAAKMNGKDFDEVIKAATIRDSKEMEVLVPVNNTLPSKKEDDIYTNQNGAEHIGTNDSSKEDDITDDVELNHREKPTGVTATVKRYNITTIFRHKIILFNSLILWYMWLVNSLVYYALSLTSSALSGDRFVNYFLIAIVEYPAALMEFLLINRIGRRKTCILFHVIAGIALAVSTVCKSLSDGAGTLGAVSLVFNLVGKFGITGSFSTIFLYTPELYPTNLRNAGIGFSSCVARAGGMLAPFAGPLMDYITWGPGAISAAMCLLAVYLLTFLPETAGYELPTTIEELKTWYKEHAGDKKPNP
ncbi:solute carrier family 22 member 8-like [Mizuhopecten yessoensis]|uniref:solute carrier family 22 member 8-like n=1 Tax=Mizuhopecten yessoensis TaxID=6573 RepID=UPI000B45EF22|nr:solute carrier family 22 member 8-like [Mizuhopecten yessoensis]